MGEYSLLSYLSRPQILIHFGIQIHILTTLLTKCVKFTEYCRFNIARIWLSLFRWKQEFKSPDDCLKKKLSVIETRLIYLVFNVFSRVNDDQMRPLLQSSKSLCKKNIYTVDQFCDWKGKPQRRTCRRRYQLWTPCDQTKLSFTEMFVSTEV